jgi:hypothetical protein
MGEIKSTLDLVMERTRNLTLSHEERRRAQDVQIERRVNGLVQKLDDGLLRFEQALEELDQLKKEYELEGDTRLMEAVIAHLDLEKENRAVMAVLEKYFRCRTDDVISVISGYQRAVYHLAKKDAERIRQTLNQNHGVCGAAVVPNMAVDSQWLGAMDAIKREYGKKFIQAKQALAQI